MIDESLLSNKYGILLFILIAKQSQRYML